MALVTLTAMVSMACVERRGEARMSRSHIALASYNGPDMNFEMAR